MNDQAHRLDETLRTTRKNRRISQTDIGASCSPQVGKVTVGLWEHPDHKKRNTPRLDQLQVYSDLTGKSVDYIIDESIEVAEGWKVDTEDESTVTKIKVLLDKFEDLPLVAKKVFLSSAKHRAKELEEEQEA